MLRFVRRYPEARVQALCPYLFPGPFLSHPALTRCITRSHSFIRFIARFIDSEAMDELKSMLEAPQQFAKDAYRLLNKCTKPDRREFIKISQAVAVGFLLMGFIGYFVKLIHLPINNIIVGA